MASEKILASIPCVEKINQHLKDEFLNLAWLQKKTEIPYGTLYGIFTESRIPLTQERLNLINIALKTEFQLDIPAESQTA